MERDRLVREVLDLQGVLARRAIGEQADMVDDAHLTLGQLRTMLVVHTHEPCPTSLVARLVGLRPNVATGVIQRLVERGWIARESDPDDGRVRLLRLTAEGEEFVADVVRAAERQHEKHLRLLDADQLAQLRSILQTLVGAPENSDKQPE
ncbi:MAG: MarR family winged helix-turn-helix transcriptional regulator [Actinomycetes bacterium]|jgi:DNA-binding MarR family transcriptional regulator